MESSISNSLNRRYLRANLATAQVPATTVHQYRNTATISSTLQRLRAENFDLSETALRRFVREGSIPSVMCGNKALLYYPNVISFLTGGNQ